MCFVDPRQKKAAEEVYFKLLNAPAIDFNYLFSFLFKSASFLNNKTASSAMHILPRLEMSKAILNNYSKYESNKRTSQTTFAFHPYIEKLKESLEASS